MNATSVVATGLKNGAGRADRSNCSKMSPCEGKLAEMAIREDTPHAGTRERYQPPFKERTKDASPAAAGVFGLTGGPGRTLSGTTGARVAAA